MGNTVDKGMNAVGRSAESERKGEISCRLICAARADRRIRNRLAAVTHAIKVSLGKDKFEWKENLYNVLIENSQ